MSARESTIAAFLARAGWGDARRGVLAGDASFRRYDRLRRGTETAVLMDAPPPHEDVRPFIHVTNLLRGLGLSAPTIFFEDVDEGLLLLEDLGDGTYTQHLKAGASERDLYALAIDVLIALRRGFRVDGAMLGHFDEARLREESSLLIDWYLPAIRGEPTPEPVRAAYFDAWQRVLPLAKGTPDTLVLRDYHVDNMLLLPERSDVAACGLLDYQDAVTGPAAYDVVSLLEDARRDVPADLTAEMIERYLAAFPEQDRAAFDASYAVLGAQRNCRIVGVFTRLLVRDGKPRYLPHIPRVWRWIEQDVRHPALAPVAQWLDTYIPLADRRIPQ